MCDVWHVIDVIKIISGFIIIIIIGGIFHVSEIADGQGEHFHSNLATNSNFTNFSEESGRQHRQHVIIGC